MKILLTILIILLFGPGNRNAIDIHTKTSKEKIPVINCESILNSKKMVRLSEIASNVQYIRLETNPSCLINNHFSTKFFFADSLIFVQNMTHVLKFSIDGKFIKRIANPGRGPGEIGNISSMSVISDKRLLVIHCRNKLVYFSFNGDLIKSADIPYHQEVKVLNDSRYIAYDPATNGSERYNFILASDQGDTISTVTNYTIWKKDYPGYISTTGPANEAFYWSKNSYFFKSKYNDTVYFVNPAKDKIEPSYSLNFGKYKIPEDLIPEKLISNPIKLQKFKEKSEYFYWGKPFEASNKVFIRLSCMGKRDIKYLLYDKANNVGASLINEIGESTGILNDWDGSIDFWPTVQKNDNEIIMPIDVLEFKKKIESTSSDKRNVKYPEKQDFLKSLVSGLDDLDNPIIMVVTLKSR
jgi:hypothetical protein